MNFNDTKLNKNQILGFKFFRMKSGYTKKQVADLLLLEISSVQAIEDGLLKANDFVLRTLSTLYNTDSIKLRKAYDLPGIW